MKTQNMRLRPLPLFVAFCLLMTVGLSFIPLAHANYPDNFDTYSTGTVNPGPWQFNPDSGSCWTGDILTGPTNSVIPQTLPNMYGIAFAPGCSGVGHVAYFAFGMNATSNVVTFSFYLNTDVPPVAPTETAVEIVICGTTEQLFINGTASGNPFIDPYTVHFWTLVSATAAVTVGGACPGGVQIVTDSSAGNTGAFRVDIDTTSLIGGNAVVAGANFYLIQYSTQSWFPISNFPNSFIRVNYATTVTCSSHGMTQASPTVCIYPAPINVPDINLYLTGATLVTMNLNSTIPYTRTLIPQPNLYNVTSPMAQRMYLDVPNACPSICSYQLTVNDFTGFYPASTTEAYVLQGQFIITSAPLDAQSILAMTMQPGIYTLTLISINGINSITQPLSLTATNENPSVLIQNGTSPVTIGPFQQFSYSASWDCDTGGITATVTDSLGTMTQEVFKLFRYNVTLPLGVIIASNTQVATGGPGFSVSYDFRNSTIGTGNLNFNSPNEYQVAFELATPTGNQIFGNFPIAANPTCIHQPASVGSSSSFQPPSAVLGLSQIFYVANAYNMLLALIVIVFTVGIVAARFGHMVMLVMGAEVGLFSLMNWLPLAAATLAPIFLFIGALGVINNRARKPIV